MVRRQDGGEMAMAWPFPGSLVVGTTELYCHRQGVLRQIPHAEADSCLHAVRGSERAMEVCRAGAIVHLAPKEYAVLELLMAEAGAVLSRDALMRRVWDYSFEGDSNVVETSIKRLRRVIDSGRATPLIQTVRGAWYKISAPR